MIRVERNLEDEKIEIAKARLAEEKGKTSGKYNTDEVVDALKLVFSNKCYICENKIISSYNIEHLRPHRNSDTDLKFDWNNLFLACAHCNNIKSDRYENILDCTQVDVDNVISFRKLGNFSFDEVIEIKAIQHSTEIDNTVKLLNEVYNGTTTMKKLESLNIKKELRKEIGSFIDSINEYLESAGEDKEDAMCLVRKKLKANSPFAAFKRWIIKDQGNKLKEFL